MRLRNIAIACAAAGVAFGAAMPSAEGKYIRPQIERVPVDRLVANLSKLADENPKDAQVRFNLARLHAMAFALKTDTAEIRKGQEENGAFFGYEPQQIPFAVQETKDEDKLKEGKVQLAKAIDRYREALKLDPNLLPAQLGYAWLPLSLSSSRPAFRDFVGTSGSEVGSTVLLDESDVCRCGEHDALCIFSSKRASETKRLQNTGRRSNWAGRRKRT